MAWRIEYDAGAEKDLSKLDRQIAQRIIRFLGEREIQDKVLRILVIQIGDRKEIYH